MTTKKKAGRNGSDRKPQGNNLFLEEGTRRIHPKLRMIANCKYEVNELRAEHNAALTVKDSEQEPIRGEFPKLHTKGAPKIKPTALKSVARGVQVNAFVRLNRFGGKTKVPKPLGTKPRARGNLVVSQLALSDIKALANDDQVAYIELGEPLKAPIPSISAHQAIRPTPPIFPLENRHQYGKKVLIGIIDVQGFDFAHDDFIRREDGKPRSRFVRIWDQGGTNRKGPLPWNYGSEFTQKMLNAALDASSARSLGIPATLIEEQSQQIEGSHGTHVASIAAGNSGICREAMIAAVLVSIPTKDVDGRNSFYDSTRVADAVDYLINVAKASDVRADAVCINISLGTNGHAHDASSGISRWIDHAMDLPGRCVTVAAGNSGQEAARYEGDLGYLMGRIHTSGTIPARELYRDLDWVVVGNSVVDVSENELEIWYGAQDRFAVQVRPPGCEWLEPPIEPRQFVENQQLRDPNLPDGGGSFISIYNELYHPANGANYISVYLTPLLDKTGTIGVPSGTWTVRLIGREVRDGRFHGWIERDDPRPAGRAGNREAWRFPSFFGENSNVDDSSVSSLACGRRVISVANLDQFREQINVTSSQGPTRDGRFKPDISAPGTNITAAKGFGESRDEWITMTGTSMASPYVCGIAGLMLCVNNSLTSAQIEGIMQRTAKPLPSGTFAWKNDAGYGKIDPARCLEETASVEKRTDLTR